MTSDIDRFSLWFVAARCGFPACGGVGASIAITPDAGCRGNHRRGHRSVTPEQVVAA